jgi:hypothetical protein
MREYFDHKLVSSLANWREASVLNGDRVIIRYGRSYISVDFLVSYKKKSALIVIIDGIHMATPQDVKYKQEIAKSLRGKIIQTENADDCCIIVCGRHKLGGLLEGVVDMTGIYNHEKCFERTFEYMKKALELPSLTGPEEVNVGCSWWRPLRLRRKRSNGRIVPLTVAKKEPFAVTHAKIVAILNNKGTQSVYASPHIKITEKHVPYGTLDT